MTGAAVERLEHPALEQAPGEPLSSPGLTDRQRLAVLLQGSALLSLLGISDWRLVEGWRGARVDPSGLLRSVRAVPGRQRRLPQVLLMGLSRRLFGGDPAVPGRGPARRLLRRLLSGWDQTLAAVSPDEAVGRLLEEAPFLWEGRFAAARSALAGVRIGGAGSRAWVAGPGWFRARLLAGGGVDDLGRRLAAPDSRRRWEDWHPGRGRPRGGVRARREGLRLLLSQGRYEAALGLGRGRRAAGDRVLRVRCLVGLGRLRAARRALQGLESAELEPAELLEAAEAAVRVYANLGRPAAAAGWVKRALAETSEEGRLRAELLAAAAAWDRDDPAAMRRHLAAARRAVGVPELAWRWHHARGLAAWAAGDGAAMVDSLGRALRGSRRRLDPVTAATLWNELGLGRAAAGDLAGAERALLHALRLLRRADGPRPTSLALCNLAEIRLRRGRPRGVRRVLERSARENRRAGNWRALAHDHELWARYELVRGRPRAALDRVRGALADLERRQLDWHRRDLHAVAARALGWLGRKREAWAELGASGDSVHRPFESEERPALWALAGAEGRAYREAGADALAPLWRRVLSQAEPRPADWERLERLESYRAARLVYDLEMVRPGAVPRARVRQAAAVLRRGGAASLARRLESRGEEAWVAVGRYLAVPRPPGRRLADLLAAVGHPRARLIWEGGGGRRVIVAGEGGGEEVSTPAAGGRLVLLSDRVDGRLETALLLAARELTPRDLGRRETPGAVIVGRSPDLLQALGRVAQLAPRPVPILIHGETGTGKELVARRVHELSRRADRPWLPVNCAALAEHLQASDLFGHVRGAFTGAERDRPGLFEAADGGTLFLDEIGDLPLDAQGLLLRVLQEGEVRRVGESRHRRVDVRVVAATHRDLERRAEEGRFRRDLLYRLDVGSVRLPPLRERDDDVRLLAEHFLDRLAPAPGVRLAPEALALLLEYPWPGNVRELENVLSVAVAFADGGDIRPEHLDLRGAEAEGGGGYHQRVFRFRRRLVLEALAATGGNRTEAARRLRLSRQALYYLIEKLGI